MPTPLIRQKLAPPASPRMAIARPRLAAQLEAAIAEGRHVAVVAGSGYGKTTFLADWARAQGAAWLSLEADDADLDVFLSYMIGAFEEAIEGFTSEAAGMLGRAREREGALAALSALLSDLDEQVAAPIAIVIDDYHLAASPTLDTLLGRMLKYMPPHVRLVLTARRQPGLELAALQAAERLTVLGERELSFDAGELAVLRPELDSAAVTALHARTGGWPAAMGMTPELTDAYLEEQVLAPQPPEVVAQLQRLSLVESFDASLCEEALEVPLTPERRDWLLQHRLIHALDRDRFALSAQLRDLLRRRFEAAESRETRRELLRRVGDHYWLSGQASTGLRFWIDAGEAAWAADRLESVAEAWLEQGRLEALASAIAHLGPEAERPALLGLQGELQRRWGDFARAEALFDRALAAFGSGPGPLARARTRLRQALAAGACGHVGLARERLADALPALAGDERAALDVMNLEGGLALLEGHTEPAIARFERALLLARRLGDRFAEARAGHNMGVCYTRLGEFGRALACYEDGARSAGPDGAPSVWMTSINRAMVLIQLDRLDEAEDAARETLALVRRYGLAREEGYALRILGYAQQKAGRFADAQACYEAAEWLARRASDGLGIAYSLNFQAERAAVLGDAGEALRLTEAVREAMGGEARWEAISEFVQTRARALLAAGRLGEAEALLALLRDRARERRYRQLERETEQLLAELEARRAGGESQIPAPAAAEERAPALGFQCFGGFRAWRRGAEIGDREWQTVRAKQLLTYMLHAPEGATKQRLLEVVYPGEAASDGGLHMALMRLRKALEPGLEKGQPSRYVLRQEGRYLFNRQSAFELDTLAFEQALSGAARGGADERAQLEQAIGLYRGEFLPEHDAEWVLAARQRFQEQALKACLRLVAIADAEGAPAAMDWLHRALAIDPLSEEVNRELILRYVEAGEPHRARQHYQLCERRYRELLDAPPPPDLAQLVASAR